MTKGRFASLPDGQQKSRVSADGLSVTIWDESGTKNMTLGFADAAGSEGLPFKARAGVLRAVACS